MMVRIWDWPTRLFHWLIVLLIVAAWWTAEQEELDWHYRVGSTILFLLVFRILWGLIGSSTARFSRFVRGPRFILAYLRGNAPPAIGHNPLGALSVLSLIAMLCAQVVLGLVNSDGDGINMAPLAHLVSEDVGEIAHELHETGFNLLLVLIGLHVAAILYHAVIKRQNLVGPMLSGRGAAPKGAAEMVPAPWWRFFVAAAVAGALVWWVWNGV